MILIQFLQRHTMLFLFQTEHVLHKRLIELFIDLVRSPLAFSQKFWHEDSLFQI